MAFDYNLFVIGAGPGGLAAAKKAASYGVRVAIAEQEIWVQVNLCKSRLIFQKTHCLRYHFALQKQIAPSYGWSECQTYFDWTLFY